jgi:hypothetical protein
MGRRADQPVLDFGTCRILAKEVVPFPVPRWFDGSNNKTTITIRTDVAQNVIYTRGVNSSLITLSSCRTDSKRRDFFATNSPQAYPQKLWMAICPVTIPIFWKSQQGRFQGNGKNDY